MSEHMFKGLIPVIVLLLIIWFLYRLKKQIKQLVKNEIYDNFPSIKNTINNFEQRIEHLRSEVYILEHKVNELVEKVKK